MKIWEELKRRNVVRVAIAYAVVSWLIIQVGDVAADGFGFPDWFLPMVFVLVGLGFPIVLIFSWAFEFTPEGVKKTKDVDQSDSVTHGTGQKINKLIIGGLAVAVAFLLVDKFFLATPSPTPEPEIVAEQQTGTSIAVLPFVNLSDDPEQEFFSDGISEELLNVLVRVEGLQVASRTSAFAFKGQNPNLQEVAEKLNVDHILEGSVRRSGDTIRITAQLIDGRTDRHLWSETYDREFKDIFAIQDEISSAIVVALRTTLGIDTIGDASVSVKTENLGAYEAYLRGRELFTLRTNLGESASLLERAIELDPNFAEAIETLAATYSVMPSWGFDDRDYFMLSAQIAEQAIALNPDLSLSYAVLGNHFGLNRLERGEAPDWARAFGNLDRAVANDSKNATAFFFRGINRLELGLNDLALADFEACLAIDPLYGNCKRHKSFAVLIGGNEEEALRVYQESVADGYVPLGAFPTVYYLYAKNDDPTAFVLMNQVLWGQPGFPFNTVREAVRARGQDHRARQAEAETWIARIETTSLLDDLAVWDFYFSNYDGIENLNFDYSYFQWLPEARDFRQHPKFKAIANHRGYKEAWEVIGYPPGCRPIGDNDFECTE